MYFLLLLLVAIYGTVGIGSATADPEDEGGASFAPNLALDLEGGTQLILTPRADDGQEITSEDIDQAIAIIRQRVDGSGVAEAEITSQGGSNIVVAIPGEVDEETVALITASAQMRMRPVLQVANPGTIDPAAVAAAQAAAESAATDPTAVDPNAVDPNAVIDPNATVDPSAPADGATETPAPDTGADGAMPAEAAAATDAPSDPATETATPEPTEAATPPTAEEIDAAATSAADLDGDGTISSEPLTEPTNPSDQAWLTEQVYYDLYTLDCTLPENRAGGSDDDLAAPLVACSPDGTAKYALGPVELTGSDLTSAQMAYQASSTGASTNIPIVQMNFTNEGGQKFADVTTRLSTSQAPLNQFAIVLDGLVISAPSVNQPIPNGEAQISGPPTDPFTRAAATTLANQLNFGSLPLTFEVQSQEQISATLGTEQLERGMLAGAIGLVLVLGYSFLQYRGLGIVTVASLVVAGALTYGLILLLSWWQGYRLSLPGVTGLIIAIGVTADSFIVYFERIRDEVREGRTLQAAVDHGWIRARRTILASDAVNVLAAVILYFIAVGGVRGFAFTLGLTTVIDLVVVILFTHPLMKLLVRTKFFGQGHRFSGLDPVHLGASVAAYAGRGRARTVAERAAIVANADTRTIAQRKADEARAEAEAAQAQAHAESGVDSDVVVAAPVGATDRVADGDRDTATGTTRTSDTTEENR
ncbi:Protein-export membrane protein SecD [Serinibacter arcticus]|uniref:Protein translocase subunit SecD n=1 Tax=Serinibacter arcticus TaxID=1655435 RepID=A0A4Z1E243_9MICO|nr:Protein-export membrane protein SecD [Serinibacter arcticus]